MQRFEYNAATGENLAINVTAWTDGTRVQWVDEGRPGPEGWQQISDAEAEALLAPSPQQLEAKLSAQIDARLLAWLKQRRYDGPDSLGKYMNLSDEAIAALPAASQPVVTRYRAECRHAAAKVSETWATAELILGRALAGNWPTPGAGQVPTDITDIEGELPVLEWPHA